MMLRWKETNLTLGTKNETISTVVEFLHALPGKRGTRLLKSADIVTPLYTKQKKTNELDLLKDCRAKNDRSLNAKANGPTHGIRMGVTPITDKLHLVGPSWTSSCFGGRGKYK